MSIQKMTPKSEQLFSQIRHFAFAKAFRGELVPQDPRDEPASELLARIRTTRDAATPKKNAEPEAPKDA